MHYASCEACTGSRKALCDLVVSTQVDIFSSASVAVGDMIEWTTARGSILEPYAPKIVSGHMEAHSDLRESVLGNVSRDLGEIGCSLSEVEIEQRFASEVLLKINEL